MPRWVIAICIVICIVIIVTTVIPLIGVMAISMFVSSVVTDASVEIKKYQADAAAASHRDKVTY